MAESIDNENKVVFTKPTLSSSNNPDAAARAVENKQFEMEWQVDYKVYKKEVRRFDDNWVKAYALVWETYCSKEVQIAIKEMADYDTHIKNDPLALLERVRTLMHTPQNAKYPPLTLVEVLYFLKVKQGKKEILVDYYSRV